ncbi:MAG: SufD family Fe-S cluster assembly protein [Candidatus Levyibacteriota bacterium]|nr:MAG: SufD family Fe-S cluster assembly protein [Candidatus Levybacteria bacterium]
MKNIKIVVNKNEEKVVPFVWVNGKETEVSIEARLAGDGASLKIVGIFFGSDSHSVIFNTNVVHEAKNTKSLTTIRGVFTDHASINNDGMVRINKGAKNADGYFASKILLFDNAKGRSVPSLEIDENELKAGHASTVGRPDENQLFYLRSRGLSEKQASELIVSGFFEPIITLLPQSDQEVVRKEIYAAI